MSVGGDGQVTIEIINAESVGMSNERVGWARDLVANHVTTGRSPSAAAVVQRRGQVVLAEAFGVSGPHGAPLDIDDVWPIASAGKPITAAAVMSLVEEGRVGINQPVVDYIPELTGPEDDDVLVHHLLTHSAGWESAQRTHRIEDFIRSGEMTAPPPGRDLITHLFLSLALRPIRIAAPGIQMDYDNGPYELLAEIVRRETGGTLDAAMRSRLFEPLGMTRSTGIVGDDLRPYLVTRSEGLPFGPGSPVVFEGERWESSDSGAAAVHTSAPDLARFGQMILNGGVLDGTRVLAPSTVRSMVTDQIPGVPALFGGEVIPESSWGYGFTVIQERRFAYFSGGLLRRGCALHPGAGGISYWIDFANEIVGVFFEVITEIDEFLTPVSGIGHRFQDVVTAAVAE
jgi:CubicO group peptidase (beta-lactamase class C family)